MKRPTHKEIVGGLAVVGGALGIVALATAMTPSSGGGPGPGPNGLLPIPPPPVTPPTAPSDAFHILDFGADPTMQRNCLSAFEAAMQAATQAGGGRVIWIDEGNYLVTAPTTPRIVWLSPPGTVPLHFAGPGANKARIVGSNNVGTVLFHLTPDCTVSYVGFDTALHNGGVALGMASGVVATWIGACTGQTFGVRMIGGRQYARLPGPKVFGMFLNDGSRPQPRAGWTAGMDIDYNSGFELHDMTHIGSYLAVYDNGGTGEPQGLVDGYDYTPGPRADHSMTQGIGITESHNVLIRNAVCRTTSDGVGTVRIFYGSGTTPGSDHLTFDNIQCGQMVIGNVTSLLVENSNVGNVHIEPKTEAQGAFVNTRHGTVTQSPAPGAVINITGL